MNLISKIQVSFKVLFSLLSIRVSYSLTGISICLKESDSHSSWTQTHAIHEDTTLRGFAPLIRIHQNLIFNVDPPHELQQVIEKNKDSRLI